MTFEMVETETMLLDVNTGQWRTVTSMEPAPDPTPDPVPQVISRFQARAALLQAGLLSAVEAAVGSADALTQLAWAEATEWRRDSPTIVSLGSAIGLGESDIDELFIAASGVTA